MSKHMTAAFAGPKARGRAAQMRNQRRTRGFSLTELLVVLVILALLMGIVAPQVIGYLGRAKTQTAEAQIGNFKSALDLYLIDVGRYPRADEGLQALISAPGGASGWAGPYLSEADVPQDPWGAPYRYELSSDGRPVVFSLGADGVEGGSGDDTDVGR